MVNKSRGTKTVFIFNLIKGASLFSVFKNIYSYQFSLQIILKNLSFLLFLFLKQRGKVLIKVYMT